MSRVMMSKAAAAGLMGYFCFFERNPERKGERREEEKRR